MTANPWTDGILGDGIVRVLGGGTPSRSNPTYWGGSIPWASVKDFRDGELCLSDTEEYITPAGLTGSASNLIPADTPIVCTRMAVGRVASSGVDVAINQDLKALFLNSNRLNHRFALRLLNHQKPRLEALAVGSTVKGIDLGTMLGLPVRFPGLPEQARIAEVLDSLDEAIRGTDALVEKLIVARQGLMMDTFEATVRTSAVPLGHYLQGIDVGKSPNCPEKPAQAGEWGVLKVSAVVSSGFRPNENKAVLNPVHFSAAYEVHPGDLLITRANTYDLIAQACVVRETPPRLMLCDKTLRLKSNAKASVEFLSIALTTPTARRHIEINATGSSGSMKNITQGAIRTIPVPDLDRAAQDRITIQIKALSASIEAEIDLLNKLKSLKSGLSTDLLTGRVRVAVGAPAC